MSVKKAILFYNAKILTLNPAKPIAEAILVEDGKISGLGNKEDYNLDNCSLQIDLQGKTVVPGFNDSHMHLLGIGEALEIVDLTGANNVQEIQTRLHNFMEETGLAPGTWIKGRGW